MLGSNTDYINRFSSVFEPSLLGELDKKSKIIEIRAGETILDVGQPIRAVPLVANGSLKVSRINDEGHELLLYYVKEGESCAMALNCCMMAEVSVIKGTAEDDSVLICIPVNLMDQWMVTYPTWKRYVMATFYSRFTEVLKSIDDVAFKKMDERPINYLKEKSKLSGSQLINLTHQQISDDLGTNLVVVSRLLKKLEIDKKLLLYRNQIKLFRDL